MQRESGYGGSIPHVERNFLSLDRGNLIFLEERKWRTEQWVNNLNSLVDKKNAKIVDIAACTGNTEKTVRKWLKGIPAKRDSVIALAYTLGEDEDSVNNLLELSLYPRLYVKNPDDAIWIYLLRQQPRDCTKNIEVTHEMYREEFVRLFSMRNSPQPTKDEVDTSIMEQEIAMVQSDREFKEFIYEHKHAFENQYSRLRKVICQWFGEDDADLFWKVLQENIGDKEKGKAIKKNIQSFSTTRYGKNRIRLDVPKRDHIIALGIYLAMPVDKINEILDICGFTELGEPDLIIEAILIYLIDDIEKTDPDILGIPEFSINAQFEKMGNLGITIKEQRKRAQADWGRRLGLAPLREVREIYYERCGNRKQFKPFSIAEYIKMRMEESLIKDLDSSSILNFL